MTDTWVLAVGAVVGLFVLDRILRWMEGRGWIYYRKTKPGRSAIGYHILEMSSVFQPSFKVVQEIQVEEEKGEDEAGDPLGPGPRVIGHATEEALRREEEQAG